ncbi:MAG TPA: acyltransferase [Caulobacteraceae bacterium]|jgi:peptidoglycan/LPS O-acetylase OafA/YrhL
MAAEKHRFLALDGLRGVAAAMVLATHIGDVGHRVTIISHGYLAVDLFFVLSGFVIASAYERRLNDSRRPIRDMIRARLTRLYPMMALGALVGLAAMGLGAERDGQLSIWPALASQLTFAPILRPRTDLFVLDTVAWSLMLELAVNLLHAAVLRRLSTRVIAVLAALSLAPLVWVAWRFQGLDVGWCYESWLGGLARVAFSYLTGLGLYRLYAAGRGPRISAPAPLLLAAAPAALLLQYLPIQHASVVCDLASVILLYPVLVWCAARVKLVGRSATLATLAGTISYPLYALQLPLAHIFQSDLASGITLQIGGPLAWTAFAVAMVALAAFVARYYDGPVRNWIAGGRRLRNAGDRALSPQGLGSPGPESGQWQPSRAWPLD